MSKCRICGAIRRRNYSHGSTKTKKNIIKYKDKDGNIQRRIEYYKGKAKRTTTINHKYNCQYKRK